MLYIPHDYQKNAIDKVSDNNIQALLLDPGLGKTSITLFSLLKIRECALVVAPLEVCYRVWPNEIKKWDQTNGVKYTILHGPNKNANLRKRVGVYIINPEGLKWLISSVVKLKFWPFKVLVVDESTDFKNFKSNRFELLASIINNFDRRYILTGTPYTKSYLDLWAQYYILDHGERLTDNYYHFRGRHFHQADYKGYDWKPLPGQEEEIERRVSDITIRLAGKDYLDLPERVINDIYVDVPKMALKQYAQMAKHLILEFDDGKVTSAANAAVKTGKLQCIGNGFAYITEKDKATGKLVVIDVKKIHSAKLDALQTLVEELQGNPLIVGYHFKFDLKMLLDRFPGTPAFASGMDRPEKQRIENLWNKGGIPLLFAQIGTSAKGLNLQSGGYHLAYYSLIWAWDTYEQFIKRIDRQGQKSSHVFIHRIIARKTVDELIIDKLHHRNMKSEKFLNAVYQHALEMS